MSVVAAILAVPAFLFTLPPIQEWFFNTKPEIRIMLSGELTVFDSRKIDGLTVTYSKQDLMASETAIVATSIRIINDGGRSVTPADLTESDPIGFKLTNGEVIEFSRVRANSLHLRNNVKPKIHSKDTVTLNSGLIFDPGDYVDLDLLVLKPKKKTLLYRPVGKIASQSTIEFLDNSDGIVEADFVDRTFSGGLWEQISRLLFYSFIAVGIVGIVTWISDRIEILKEKRQSRLYKEEIDRIAKIPTDLESNVVSFFNLIIERFGVGPILRFHHEILEMRRLEAERPIPDKFSFFGTEFSFDQKSLNRFTSEYFIDEEALVRVLTNIGLMSKASIDSKLANYIGILQREISSSKIDLHRLSYRFQPYEKPYLITE